MWATVAFRILCCMVNWLWFCLNYICSKRKMLICWQGFVTNYPDVKIDQLVSLLTMRGDVSRSDARQVSNQKYKPSKVQTIILQWNTIKSQTMQGTLSRVGRGGSVAGSMPCLCRDSDIVCCLATQIVVCCKATWRSAIAKIWDCHFVFNLP